MDLKVRKECPKCGKVNKHNWEERTISGQGYFVVVCECGESYLQAFNVGGSNEGLP